MKLLQFLKVFQPLKEELIIKHIAKLSKEERESLQTVHYGYLSSKVIASAKKRLWKTIAFAEFCLALESKSGPITIAVYRAFGSTVSQLKDLKLGDKVYVRCIPVNDPEEKWYYVQEIEPAARLGEFPLKYKKFLEGDKLNKTK